MAKPLTRLLRKDGKFEWDEKCQKSFDELRQKLLSKPILQYIDFSKNLILRTDASGYGISAILTQGKIGEDLPVAFASRTLNDRECRFNTTEREMLSILYGINQFRPYLYGREFLVITDHKPLQWIFKTKDSTNRLYRWRIQLAEYNFSIIFQPGKTNIADGLSRIKYSPEPFEAKVVTRTGKNTQTGDRQSFSDCIQYISENHDFGQEVIEKSLININTSSLQNQFCFTKFPPDNSPKMIQKINDNLQILQSDENNRIFFYLFCNEISYENIFIILQEFKFLLFKFKISSINFIKSDNDLNNFEYVKIKQIIRYIFRHSDISVTIFLNDVTVLTERDQINQVIEEYHNSLIGGHSASKRTIQRIKLHYYWHGMKRDIKEFIRKCDTCQKNKDYHKTRMPMAITTTSRKPMDRVYLDIVGPLNLTQDGFQYLLTFQDDLTRFVHATPLRNQEADTIARAFTTEIVLRFGSPLSLLTDLGANFQSDLLKRVCKLLKIKKLQTSGYHPETNGALERSHKTLKEYLRNYINKNLDDWNNYIPYALFMLNSTPSTSTGFTPFELMHGFKANLPLSVCKTPDVVYNYDDYYYELRYKLQNAYKNAHENLIQSKEQNKRQFDKRTNPLQLEVGDQVLLRKGAPKKLGPQFDGPYEVTEILSDLNSKIRIKNSEKIVHNNRLKRFIE